METSRFLNTFMHEAMKSIKIIESNILILKNESENTDAANNIKNASYTLRTIAFTMGYDRIGEEAGIIKNALSKITTGGTDIDAESVKTIIEGVNRIKAVISDIQHGVYEKGNTSYNKAVVSKDGLNEREKAKIQACEKKSDNDKGNKAIENEKKYIFVSGDELNMGGILIASGDGFSRIILRDILERNNCNLIYEAADSKGALECYKEYEPDIVIVDADFSDDKCVRELLDYDSMAKIVMASSEDSMDSHVNTIRNGSLDFIVKPVKARELMKAIRKQH